MGTQEKKESARRLTSADQLAISIGGAALVAAIVVMAIGHGIIVSIVGASLFGLGGIALVALMFLMIGESEDRHYQREHASWPRSPDQAPRDTSPAPRRRSS